MLKYTEIRVNLPRIRIIKLSATCSYLDDHDVEEMKQKLVEVDVAINRLLHAKSILERILLRNPHL